ncbi:hypothetical protein K402DRAFT_398442 [Aulographum hederae CBS 113979]|uniref:Uncharacterized protein n=1 Tax=Aulographum hederae CBS 113979 TaxID=1176131 RepID=A0A6G1GKT5_9PEZI|nr:hypothetical protein K402DRAFT_398442 [Aulographum hederae CBS 113979]
MAVLWHLTLAPLKSCLFVFLEKLPYLSSEHHFTELELNLPFSNPLALPLPHCTYPFALHQKCSISACNSPS